MDKIRVQLKCADSRLIAGIDHVFKHSGNGFYELSSHGDIELIDGDSVEGIQFLKKGVKPESVILTVNPQKVDHAFIVKKPVKTQELLDTLLKAFDVVKKTKETSSKDENKIDKTPVGNPFAKYTEGNFNLNKKQDVNLSDQNIDEAQNTKMSKDLFRTDFESLKNLVFSHNKIISYDHEKYISQEKYCGVVQNINFEEETDVSHLYFQSNKYLCGLLLAMQRQQCDKKQLFLLEFEGDIVLSFSDGIVLTSLSEESLNLVSLMPVDLSARIKEIKSLEEIKKTILNISTLYKDDFRSFTAKCLLWTSRGRLIEHTSINSPLGLMKKTVDIPKDLELPFMDEIQSLWSHRNVSIKETFDLLHIDQRYIFSFYNLCYAYGFFSNASLQNSGLEKSDLDSLLDELKKL